MTDPSPPEKVSPGPLFATTHWSVVLAAREPGDSTARRALETLCRAYWFPIYAYIRRSDHNAGEAEDLTQEFFYRLLDRNFLAQVDPGKGRFRSFLLVAVNHFLANERDRLRAVKRGGRVAWISLDGLAPEERYRLEPGTDLSPEAHYELRWALALLAQALERLRAEYQTAGKESQFEQLKARLTEAESAEPYTVLAQRLGTTEAGVKMAVLRLRQRYAGLLRAEIASTVSTPDEVEEELRYLSIVLTRH